MSIVTMEGEIVDVNVSLKQVVRQRFAKHRQACLQISRGLGSYFKTGQSFAGLTRLVVGISEGKKDFVPSHNNYVEPRDLLDEFSLLIVWFNPLLVDFVAYLKYVSWFMH